MSRVATPNSYDISPTTPLPGLHLNGVVTRRFLISYPVRPEALSRFLPPNAELSTWQGLAWVSACFVNIQHMRPSVMPCQVGIEFNYLVHRTRARIPYPDGVRRESVLVLEANISNRAFAAIGQRLPGVGFHARDIRLLEHPDCWRVQMRDDAGALFFQADIAKDSIGDALPAARAFPTWRLPISSCSMYPMARSGRRRHGDYSYWPKRMMRGALRRAAVQRSALPCWNRSASRHPRQTM